MIIGRGHGLKARQICLFNDEGAEPEIAGFLLILIRTHISVDVNIICILKTSLLIWTFTLIVLNSVLNSQLVVVVDGEMCRVTFHVGK